MYQFAHMNPWSYVIQNIKFVKTMLHIYQFFSSTKFHQKPTIYPRKRGISLLTKEPFFGAWLYMYILYVIMRIADNTNCSYALFNILLLIVTEVVFGLLKTIFNVKKLSCKWVAFCIFDWSQLYYLLVYSWSASKRGKQYNVNQSFSFTVPTKALSYVFHVHQTPHNIYKL